ncbi:MAG TPA: DUF2637 domain-containing protein [Streptosporangiaceae bacterium]|nr:DUF2637 domain-containing protein [Streptosporangiaceae bacterium]
MTDTALGRLAAFAAIVVACESAIVSHAHIYVRARHLGQAKPLAILMPLPVDGAVGTASALLLAAAKSARRNVPAVTKLMPGLSVPATLEANACSGAGQDIAGVALAMWPGIAFAGGTEVGLSM